MAKLGGYCNGPISGTIGPQQVTSTSRRVVVDAVLLVAVNASVFDMFDELLRFGLELIEFGSLGSSENSYWC